MHSNWRDCDAWRHQNLPMNTCSNEAAKLYDVCISQLAGWYENQQFGGLASSLNQMVNADPDFILGECLKSGVELLGTNTLLNSLEYQNKLDSFVQKANSMNSSLTNREKLHVNAIQKLKCGDLPKALDIWEQILIEHPTDMMAIKFSHSVYFYTGEAKQMRDCLARVIPCWKNDLPLFNYLYGLYSFGLTQTGELTKAEKYGQKGLELNRFDGWATHSLAHVNEVRGSFEQGIKLLTDTEQDWIKSDLISSHNYWHLSLFYMEKGEHESVLNILDNNPAFKNPKASIDLINCSSLLTRLKLDGFKDRDYLQERFLDLKERFHERIDQHGYVYSDSHVALVLGMCGTEEEKAICLKSLDEFINSNKISLSEYIRNLNDKLATKLFKALFHFGQNEFEQVVELLYPIRYELYEIGGSNEQRDVFNLILTDSCFRSKLKYHNIIGNRLIYERLAYKPSSNLAKRISSQFFVEDMQNF